MMDKDTARRILLALMGREKFDFIADITQNVADSRPVQEDFGFSPGEIAGARADREAIVGEYSRLKGRRSFWAADVAAKLAWLSGIAPDGGDPPPATAAPPYADRLVYDRSVSETSPVVRGTRITAADVLAWTCDGWRWDNILRVHPELTTEDIRACLEFIVSEGLI